MQVPADRHGAGAAQHQGEIGHLGIEVLFDLLDRTAQPPGSADHVKKGAELAFESGQRGIGGGVVGHCRGNKVPRRKCFDCAQPVLNGGLRREEPTGEFEGGGIRRGPCEEESL